MYDDPEFSDLLDESSISPFQVIKQSRGLDVNLLRVLSAQLCLAVNSLHLKGVIHRDVKVRS